MSNDERPDQESTVQLLGGLIGDAKDLAIAHLDGLRLEVKGEFRELKTATALAAAAAAAFAVGAMLAAFAIVHAVWTYTALPQWASYGVIAAICFAVGVAVLVARKRRGGDADLIPENGLLRMKRDAKFVATRAQDAMS
jgi:hypothetical protein